MSWRNPKLIETLKNGELAVMPTDTIYGIVARAEDQQAVERVYTARHRAPEKPCIILIGDERDINNFGVELTDPQKEKLKEYWPADKEAVGAVSIVLDCPSESYAYLHRGTQTLAFRLPRAEDLRFLLTLTGPLIAPSANTEGATPARTITEARNYFGNQVSWYEDGGEISGLPSRVIKLHKDGFITILR